MTMGRRERRDLDPGDAPPSTARPARTLQLGVHHVELEDPDTCTVRFGGDLDEHDVALILDAFEAFAIARERAYLLIDLASIGRITPGARRLSGMRQLPPQYAGLTLFGGTFEQQLVAKLATEMGLTGEHGELQSLIGQR